MIYPCKLLVVVAHPDDEVLGCAGLLMKNHFSGGKNYVLYLNNGCHYRENFSQNNIYQQIKNVSDLLKFDYTALNYETGKFDTYPQIRINNEIRKIIDGYKPDVVITHISNDLHRDHQVVNHGVMVATRYNGQFSPKVVMEMPVISSSEVNPAFNFVPNYFVGIDQYINTKIMAMMLYEEEYSASNKLRGSHGIVGWATFYGMHVNESYAEAYKIVRMIE